MAKIRHYVAMYCNELGEEMRLNSEIYEYLDFDENDKIKYNAFQSWYYTMVHELILYTREHFPENTGVWLERLNSEKYNIYNNYMEYY